MSLLEKLCDASVWRKFYEYKTSQISSTQFSKKLDLFIKDRAYLRVYKEIAEDNAFPLPRKAVISKMSSKKKRVVYIYPEEENTVLKLLTYLMLRKYDGIFSAGLYSFRPERTAKDAVRRLTGIKNISGMYCYKADIHDYFNSIPVDELLPMLKDALSDDTLLYEFLYGLLSEPRVVFNGAAVTEKKGVMAGTPVSAFYANLYLSGLDRYFEEKGAVYARYSDDIIVFSETEEEARENASFIRSYLNGKGLSLNPDKEFFSKPEDGFCFLGFEYKNGEVDIAPKTMEKLKGKMYRKSRALSRWKKRNGQRGEHAARAFIRIFNRKLLEGADDDNELTWSHWFFSVINTTKSLRVIDQYAQDCIRFLISGKRNKSRYKVKYGDMKALGYKSLVNEYYRFSNEAETSLVGEGSALPQSSAAQ